MAGIVPRASNKMGQDCEHGHSKIRVWCKGMTRRKPTRYLLKCGCCHEKLEVHLSHGTLEIGGINSSPEEWARVLVPMMAMASSMAGRRERIMEKLSNFRAFEKYGAVDASDIDVEEMGDKLSAFLSKEFGMILPGFESSFLARLIVDLNNSSPFINAEGIHEEDSSFAKLPEIRRK